MKLLVDITDRRFALVLVDIQSMFTDETPGLGESIVTRIGTINDAVEGFRRSGLPVVYIRYEGLDHSGQEIDPERTGFIDGLLQPEAGEHIIGKIEMDAFLGTDLEDILKDKGCDSVLICGMVAQYCVLATYFGAFQHGFSPYMLENGICSTDEENVRAVEHITKTLSMEELRGNRYFRSDR